MDRMNVLTPPVTRLRPLFAPHPFRLPGCDHPQMGTLPPPHVLGRRRKGIGPPPRRPFSLVAGRREEGGGGSGHGRQAPLWVRRQGFNCRGGTAPA